MSKARFVTTTALFTATLICVQLALSGVGGIELVTVFFLAFCFYMGIRAGVAVAICFSLLRCFLFGFYPSVIILYLIYYPLFALFFGWFGTKFGHKITNVKFFFIVLFAVIFTAFFSMLDCAITPLIYGFNNRTWLAYFYSSLPFMGTQIACVIISVSILFIPLVKGFEKISRYSHV